MIPNILNIELSSTAYYSARVLSSHDHGTDWKLQLAVDAQHHNKIYYMSLAQGKIQTQI